MISITPMWIFLASLFALISSFQASPAQASQTGFSLELAPDTIQPSEQIALLQFVSDAEALLPPQLKNIISRKITVRFTKNLDSTQEFQIPQCGPGKAMTNEGARSGSPKAGVLQVRGAIKAGFFGNLATIGEVELNAAMKEEIIKGPRHSTPYACGHHDLYQLAMATLLHEVSHVYDFTNYQMPELQQELDAYCQNDGGNEAPSQSVQCTDIINHMRVISRLPSFMSLVDWDVQDETRLNFSALRSPDPYEFSKIEEEFAVNMEYFLLDPEFACRRPSEFEYLRDHFNYDPFPNRSCQAPNEVQLSNDSLGTAGGSIVNLDVSRIYQIHYLFASEGTSFASKWGHAMFRIVMCNKSRTQVGPDCLSDIDDQIIVSYRANSGDWSVSAWDGLTGKYPSQIFLYKMYPDIVNEYTVDQFRNLISLPLKLTDAEKNRFVQRVVEQYWQYTGKYYFVSNNCATEALHMLKGVYRDFSFQNWSVLTPVGLYGQLASAGLIDKSLLDNPDSAAKNGYEFLSERDLYVDAFNQIKGVSPRDVPVSSFQQYISQSTAANRLALYKNLLAVAPASKTANLANPFFILETYIRHAAGNAFMNSIMTRLHKESGEMEQKMNQVLDLANGALPWNSSMGGYGIPLAEDAPASEAASAESDAQNSQVKALYADVMSWAQKTLAAQSSELSAITANEQFFLSQIEKR